MVGNQQRELPVYRYQFSPGTGFADPRIVYTYGNNAFGPLVLRNGAEIPHSTYGVAHQDTFFERLGLERKKSICSIVESLVAPEKILQLHRYNAFMNGANTMRVRREKKS
ncbi:MAG: hypothetical protein ACMXYF_05380 [Candidatus Woesearchaeota archaeon]